MGGENRSTWPEGRKVVSILSAIQKKGNGATFLRLRDACVGLPGKGKRRGVGGSHGRQGKGRKGRPFYSLPEHPEGKKKKTPGTFDGQLVKTHTKIEEGGEGEECGGIIRERKQLEGEKVLDPSHHAGRSAGVNHSFWIGQEPVSL